MEWLNLIRLAVYKQVEGLALSRMNITEEQDKRMSESRKRIIELFYTTLGSYIEQESKKMDQWRDETYGQLFGHLKHEVGEIGRSKTKTTQIHNCMDSAMLSLLLLDKVLEG